jgi:hypothetical protein
MKGVDVYNFSGCGLTKTIGGITAKKKRSWTSLWLKVVDDYSIDYTNGDETVPLISAVGPFDNHNYYVKSAVHSELPSVSGVPETIFSLLSGNKTPTFSNVSTSSDLCDVKGIVLSTHSPVAINIYDNSGNHTGPTDTGDIEYGLSDISYDKILDDTFAFIPDDNQNYMLLIKPVATDTSAYDLSLENVGSNNKKTRKTYWNKIPVKTTSSNSQIFFSSTSTDYLIKVDEDGDGIFESTSSPSSILASSTAEDIISPQTIVLISQDGTVSLSATDDNAGVLETEYSLDGNTWNLYTAPFSASGNTVSYFSTDNAGNVETPQSIVVPEPVKRGTKRRSISIIGTSTQDTSSASIFISGVQNQNYSEATLQPISLIQNIQQLSTSSSRASSSTIKISNRRTPRKTMRTFVATTSSQSVSPSNLNLTASVANSGSNLGSIIGVFFQKIWTHLFLFFKKIL